MCRCRIASDTALQRFRAMRGLKLNDFGPNVSQVVVVVVVVVVIVVVVVFSHAWQCEKLTDNFHRKPSPC